MDEETHHYEARDARDDDEEAENVPSATDSEAVPSPPRVLVNIMSSISPSAQDVENPSRLLFEAEWHMEYKKVLQIKRKQGTWKVEEIEPALDDMINAKDCHVQCSRWPTVVYFRQNSLFSDHYCRCLFVTHRPIYSFRSPCLPARLPHWLPMMYYSTAHCVLSTL